MVKRWMVKIEDYKFSVSLLDDEDGGGYLIEFINYPGCIATGDTINELLKNAQDSLKCRLKYEEENS